MKTNIVVLRHVPHEHLGLAGPVLESAGLECQYVDFFADPQAVPALDRAGGLVVLGGPMNVDETDRYPFLATGRQLIAEAWERKLPVLGICLGAQLIARTLGAEVRPNRVKEIGWYPLQVAAEAADDPLLRHLADGEVVLHWHGDTFDVPPGAVRLASSERCLNQAFRAGDRTWGLQFHVEAGAEMVGEWLDDPDNVAEACGLGDPEAASRIRVEAPAQAERMQALTLAMFGEFAARVLAGPERHSGGHDNVTPE